MATVKIEGNTLTLDDAICKSDKSLRDALLPFYPAVANAKIKREKKGEDLVITITKQAGDKGLTQQVATALDQAEEKINPVLAVQQNPTRPMSKRKEDQLLLAAAKEIEAIARTTRNLDLTSLQPSSVIPLGF